MDSIQMVHDVTYEGDAELPYDVCGSVYNLSRGDSDNDCGTGGVRGGYYVCYVLMPHQEINTL